MRLLHRDLDGKYGLKEFIGAAIPPYAILSHVWGETGEANFPDQKTAEATVGAVMAHYNSVAEAMTRSPWIEPIYEVDPNSDEVMWEPWIDGFTRAMGLRPDAWDRLLAQADEETRTKRRGDTKPNGRTDQARSSEYSSSCSL